MRAKRSNLTKKILRFAQNDKTKKVNMKKVFLLATIMIPLGIFAQENGNLNPQVQIQNVNYYNQIDDNNNSLGNVSNKINDDVTQTNIAVQQANPPAQQQGSSLGNIFSSSENENQQTKKPYCKDCEEVKKAIAAAHSSSESSHNKKSFSIRKWADKFSFNMNAKMKKMFARKYKAHTSFEVCFNW